MVSTEERAEACTKRYYSAIESTRARQNTVVRMNPLTNCRFF